MITPYYQDTLCTIYHGDCREILPQLEKVDLVLTDPPYGMNWSFSGQGSGKNGQGGTGSRFKNKTIIGDDCEFDPSFLLKYKKVIIWGFQHFPQYFNRGTVLVWVKKYPDAYGTFLSDADLAWMNSGHGVYLSETINPSGFQSEREHPTQKPVSLMRWCIEKAGGSGVVLDPFMGSGTTLVAAKNLGRKSIGIELEQKYCDIAIKRLRQETIFSQVTA